MTLSDEYTESFMHQEDDKAVCAKCGMVKMKQAKGYWRYFPQAEANFLPCKDKHDWRLYCGVSR